MLPILLSSLSFAQEITIQNDTAINNTFGFGDMVGGLAYPECVISVLAPDPTNLPLDLHTVEIFFASQFGSLDNQATSVVMGIQNLPTGQDPTAFGNWDWDATLFNIIVNSQALNALSLLDPQLGTGALTVTSGTIAVWICAPDPEIAVWPYDSFDVSGIVLHSASPSTGTFLYDGSTVDVVPNPFTGAQAPGSWVIRGKATSNASTTEPASEPAEEPADEPSSEPAEEPSTEPSTEPAEEPSSEPTSEPAEEPDIELSILAVTPDSTIVGEIADITVTGSGFEETSTLYVGGMLCGNIELVSDSALLATTPSALPEGIHDVSVLNSGGETVSLARSFTVEAEEEEEDKSSCAASSPQGLLWLVLALPLFRRKKD